MKPISFVGCLLFAGACNAPAPATIDATKASVDELRAAVPTRAALTIAPAATHKLDAPSACAGLGPSSFGTLTHQIAGNADGVVGGVAGIVDDITKSPPAAAAPGHAVWGPIPSPSGDVVYRLEVTGAPPSEFHFVLAGKPAAADESAWRGIFQGVSVAADATHHAGQVAVDFDVMHALDASVDPLAGKVAVHFDSDGAARAVTAAFAGIQGKSAPQPDDAQYAFQMGADQSAGLAFTTRVDFDGSGALDELAHIESRWAPTGAGVAHLAVSGGSLGGGAANAVECWDPTLARVYFADSLGHTAGDSACCP